jgi:hypothetical protein
MLVRNNIILVVRVYRLILWRDIDLFSRKFEAGEVFE